MTAAANPGSTAKRPEAPRSRIDDIDRPELLARLPGGPDAARITTLIAPAGWGKTTLIAQWIAHRSSTIDVAYLAIDRADADPGRFLAYLTGALQRAAPDLPTTDNIGSASEWIDTALPGLAAALANRDRPLAIALDDYHLVASAEVHAISQGLIDTLAPNGYLVLAARADTPLPLSRLRAAREVGDIRDHDLGFTRSQTEGVLASAYGLQLGSDSLDGVQTKTEGWPAGICLAGISLASAPDPEMMARHIDDTDRLLADFFAEEVLATIEPDLLHFLLHTSILERLNAPLAQAATHRPGATQTIMELERRHLFLSPLDRGRQWFRYHHLMSDVLRVELLRRYDEAEVAEIHLRAADWLEGDDQTRAAVEHLFAAGAHERAAALVTAEGYRLAYSERVKTVAEWCDRFPDAIIQRHPEICMLGVFTRRNLAQDGAALAWLNRYESAVPNPDPVERLAVLDARIWLDFGQGRISDAANSAEQLLGLRTELPQPGRTMVTAAADVLNGLLNVGLALLHVGDERAVPLLEEVLAVPQRSPTIDLQREAAAGTLGLHLWARGDDQSAARMVAEARRIRGDRPPQVFSIAWVVSAVLLAPDSADEAMVTRMSALSGHYSSRHVLALVQLAEAIFLSHRGEDGEARIALGEARELLDSVESSVPIDLVAARTESIIGPSPLPQASGPVELTDRELQVLRAMVGPLTQREIGNELFLSFNTIKSHSRAVYRKLGVQARKDAVGRGRQLGFLPPS